MRTRGVVLALLLALGAAACGSPERAALPPSTTASTAAAPTISTGAEATTAVPPPSTSAAPGTSAATPRTSASGIPSPGRTTAGSAGGGTASRSQDQGNATCAEPGARATPRADRPRYTVKADVRLAENAVVGDIAVRFTPDIATDRLVLRLWPNGPRSSRAGARLDVGTLRVDGRTVPAGFEGATMLVARPEGGLAAGRTVEVTLPWRLTLPGQSSDRISRSGDAVRLGSFFPILSWEPGVGWATAPPTGAFAEASSAPTADFDLVVTLPPGLTALASGAYAGGGRWRAEAMRDVALSVGRFTLAGGVARAPHPVQVTVGVAAGIGESPGSYLAKSIRVLEDFSRRYGPYPWSTYTLGITPGLGGGIEYPAHVMQGPGTLGRTTSHEIGHMWFYGLVGNDQGRDPWLDEGLATYAEARFEGTLASTRSKTIPADAAGRAGEPMTYWEAHQSSYYRGVYTQGAQAVAALGDPAIVDCALRSYVARSSHRIARNRDLIDAVRPTFPHAPEVLARYGIR